MKVLFVNTNDMFGGAARAAVRILRGVQKRGVEAQMFVKYKHLQTEDIVSVNQVQSKGILHQFVEWMKYEMANRRYVYKWRPYAKTKQKAFLSDIRGGMAENVWQKFDYDIVHLHWLNMRFIDVRQLINIHKPIVWTLHDSWPFTGICHVPYNCDKYQTHCGVCPMLGSKKERDLAFAEYEKKLEAYKDIDLHIVAPSRWMGECAKKSALLGRFPITVIPNCIDTELYHPMDKNEVRKVLGLEQGKTYLLFGAMQAVEDANKGFTCLREALTQIQNIDNELLVYGTNADMQRNDLSIHVRSLGYIHNDKMMALLYNAADLCVVPSLSENLSNTIMESLSCGTPVVAFNIGGNGDMIDHKQNGYLAAERDCADLAKGIEWCLEHNIDSALSRNAREKVLNNYAIDKVSGQYKTLYQTLL